MKKLLVILGLLMAAPAAGQTFQDGPVTIVVSPRMTTLMTEALDEYPNWVGCVFGELKADTVFVDVVVPPDSIDGTSIDCGNRNTLGLIRDARDNCVFSGQERMVFAQEPTPARLLWCRNRPRALVKGTTLQG